MMNQEYRDKPGMFDTIANKWKTASGAKKVMWLAIALLARYFVFNSK